MHCYDNMYIVLTSNNYISKCNFNAFYYKNIHKMRKVRSCAKLGAFTVTLSEVQKYEYSAYKLYYLYLFYFTPSS